MTKDTDTLTTSALYGFGAIQTSDPRCSWIDWELEGVTISSDMGINNGGFNYGDGKPLNTVGELRGLIYRETGTWLQHVEEVRDRTARVLYLPNKLSFIDTLFGRR